MVMRELGRARGGEGWCLRREAWSWRPRGRRRREAADLRAAGKEKWSGGTPAVVMEMKVERAEWKSREWVWERRVRFHEEEVRGGGEGMENFEGGGWWEEMRGGGERESEVEDMVRGGR